MRDTETMGCSRQKKVSFQWPAVTFNEHASTTNPFLTKSKNLNLTIDTCNEYDTNTVDTSSYLSVDVGGDSQSLLEWEPTWSKDRSLLSYNIDILCKF